MFILFDFIRSNIPIRHLSYPTTFQNSFDIILLNHFLRKIIDLMIFTIPLYKVFYSNSFLLIYTKETHSISRQLNHSKIIFYVSRNTATKNI